MALGGRAEAFSYAEIRRVLTEWERSRGIALRQEEAREREERRANAPDQKKDNAGKGEKETGGK